MRKISLAFTLLMLASALVAQTGGAVQSTTITLTPGQISSLKAEPTTLVAAPGSGKVISPLSMVVHYNAGTNPYSIPSGGNFQFTLGPLANDEVAFPPVGGEGFVDQPSNHVAVLAGASAGDTQTKLENQDLRVTNDGGAEWADGDGRVSITVYYTVVTLQ
jgi:hypothetical protein